jgi:hypothetical protein
MCVQENIQHFGEILDSHGGEYEDDRLGCLVW